MRNLLLDNLPLKVVALILAVTLVIVKHEEEVALVTVEVPIRVIYPTDRVLVVKPEDMVKVTVEGRYADLDKLDIPPLDVQLSGFQGETYAFEPELFKVPPGLKVKDVRPPAMLVRLEEKVVADLPVKPDLFSEPQAGYLLTEVRLEPPRIALEGARSAVERLEAVMTQRIDLTGRNQSTTLSVKLTSPPENVAFLHGNQEYQVILTIEEKVETRVIEGVAITVQGEPPGSPGYEVSPPTADITVKGPISQLDRLDLAQVQVFVNVAGANFSRRVLKSKEVDAAGPASITILEVRPGKVTLVQRDPPPDPPPEPGPEPGPGTPPSGALDAGAP